MNRILNFILLTTIFILVTDDIKSQYNYKSDKNYISENSRFLDIIGLGTFDSDNLFEMRVWINPSFNPSDLCRFILRNDSTWYVEKYDLWRKRKRTTYEKEILELGKDWNIVMDTLIDWGVLTLPNWLDIRDDWKGDMQILEGDTLYGKCVVADGTSYTIELLTEKDKRQYNYHCPKTYRDFYKNVDELNSIVKILEKIFNEIEFKHDICELNKILPATWCIMHWLQSGTMDMNVGHFSVSC
jgi:hypothetical protein